MVNEGVSPLYIEMNLDMYMFPTIATPYWKSYFRAKVGHALPSSTKTS